MAKEHERKFLIDSFPDFLPLVKQKTIRQGYLITDPIEVRFRKSTDEDGESDYKLCVKGQGGVSRVEIQHEISEEDFYDCLELANLKIEDLIKKDYRKYLLPNGHFLECSIVDNGWIGSFMYAEVEFDTEEEAKAYKPIDFLGRDVTEESYYKMKRYWERKIK